MQLTAINVPGEALPEAADQFQPTLGSRCRRQGGSGSEELCQGAFQSSQRTSHMKNILQVRRRESCRERAMKRKHVFRRQKRESGTSISSDEAALSDSGSVSQV